MGRFLLRRAFFVLLFCAGLLLVACVLRSAVCLAGSRQGELELGGEGSGPRENAGVGGCRVCA